MKSLFALALIVLAATAAHAEPTAIDIIPKLKADCLLNNYPLINQVTDVQKVAEDGDSVTFSFDTAYGSCADTVLTPMAMTQAAQVQIMRDKIVLFQKDPVQTKLQIISPTQLRVMMTFDKNQIFKNRDVVNFSMDFIPTGTPPMYMQTDAYGRTFWYQPRYTFFPWEVVLTQINDEPCTMNVTVGQSK